MLVQKESISNKLRKNPLVRSILILIVLSLPLIFFYSQTALYVEKPIPDVQFRINKQSPEEGQQQHVLILSETFLLGEEELDNLRHLELMKILCERGQKIVYANYEGKEKIEPHLEELLMNELKIDFYPELNSLLDIKNYQEIERVIIIFSPKVKYWSFLLKIIQEINKLIPECKILTFMNDLYWLKTRNEKFQLPLNNGNGNENENFIKPDNQISNNNNNNKKNNQQIDHWQIQKIGTLLLLDLSNQIIFPNKNELKIVSRSLPTRFSSFSVLPYFSTNEANTWQKQKRDYHKYKGLLYVSNQDENKIKNVEWFIVNVFNKLDPTEFNNQKDKTLHIAGDICNYLKKKRFIQENGNIKLHEQISDSKLTELIQKVKIFINPVIDENGISKDNLKLMMKGMPFLFTRNLIISKYFKSLSIEHGLPICFEFDSECYQKYLILLTNDQDYWEEISKMGSKILNTFYSQKRINHKINKLIKPIEKSEKINLLNHNSFDNIAGDQYVNKKRESGEDVNGQYNSGDIMKIYKNGFIKYPFLLNIIIDLDTSLDYINHLIGNVLQPLINKLNKKSSALEISIIMHSLVEKNIQRDVQKFFQDEIYNFYNIKIRYYYSNNNDKTDWQHTIAMYNLGLENLTPKHLKIIYLNNVWINFDQLELLFSHPDLLNIDLMCGLDLNKDDSLYHINSLIEKNGNNFNEISMNKFLKSSKNIFPLYNCWSGLLLLNSEPFLLNKIKFRSITNDEKFIRNNEECLSHDFSLFGYDNIFFDKRLKIRKDDLPLPKNINLQLPSGYENHDKEYRKQKNKIKENAFQPNNIPLIKEYCQNNDNGDLNDENQSHEAKCKFVSNFVPITLNFNGNFLNLNPISKFNKELIKGMKNEFQSSIDFSLFPVDQPFEKHIFYNDDELNLTNSFFFHKKKNNFQILIHSSENPTFYEQIPNKFSILFYNWEFISLPIGWINTLNQFDLILVNSDYIKNALLKEFEHLYKSKKNNIITHGAGDDDGDDYDEFLENNKKKIQIIQKIVPDIYYNSGHLLQNNNGNVNNNNHNDDDLIINFLFVGKINYMNGFDVLIEAYTKEFENENVKLTIVTSDSLEKTNYFINKFAKQQFYPEIKIIPNWSPNIDQEIISIFKNIDYLVAPIRLLNSDSFVYEAMALGIPIIVTDSKSTKPILTKDNSYRIKSSSDLCQHYPCNKQLKCINKGTSVTNCWKTEKYPYWYNPIVTSLSGIFRFISWNPHESINIANNAKITAEQFTNSYIINKLKKYLQL
ncbi:mannosylglucosylglycerate synthase [Anaeramoeba flamelloides]|uniref:Mannosylglucosylglycerate synthase n=1 Tax=Anaeramoeba flamelloides TaxID=1746091 RepID=A0AAV7Z0J6_9EUKA|nr:mannosylglucosylglycerate synthase [Anaeramoeba flamelloides]